MNVVQVLTAALDKATAPQKPNTNQLLYAAVCQFDASAKLTKEEITKLRAAETAWQRAFKAASDFSDRNAKARWADHLRDAKVNHLDVAERTRGLASLVDEFESKQMAAKEVMFQVSCDAAQIANAVVARILPAATRLLDQRVTSEQAECAGFGLQWEPGVVTRGFKRFADSVRITYQGAPGCPPRDMLRFITLQ